MSIKLNSVGGGSVTIQEPNTASDFTLSVPAQTANILTNKTAGTVLQVVQAYKSDTFSMTSSVSNGWVDVTGLSVSITPSSASSRILVLVSCAISTNDQAFGYIRLARNSTGLFIGDSSSNRPSVSGMAYNGGYNSGSIVSLPISYVDSPSTTSSITYKVQMANGVNGQTTWLNRSSRDSAVSGDYDPRQASSIIVMEIAG
jgi:hypothetical protein